MNILWYNLRFMLKRAFSFLFSVSFLLSWAGHGWTHLEGGDQVHACAVCRVDGASEAPAEAPRAGADHGLAQEAPSFLSEAPSFESSFVGSPRAPPAL